MTISGLSSEPVSLKQVQRISLQRRKRGPGGGKYSYCHSVEGGGNLSAFLLPQFQHYSV